MTHPYDRHNVGIYEYFSDASRGYVSDREVGDGGMGAEI